MTAEPVRFNPDERLEVVTIPVSDVERAKDFYLRLGWRLDRTPPAKVQVTPPGRQRVAGPGGHLPPARSHRPRPDGLHLGGRPRTYHTGGPVPEPGLHPERPGSTGDADTDWAEWYAACLVAEQTGGGAS
ncbi:VOC family protein [Streptomyces olivaceoviridis]|uniref:VOC family protein n=1 Tax=Streptomyces olivaceoviridis TaxID=1921 RepID=UPI0033AF97DF